MTEEEKKAIELIKDKLLRNTCRFWLDIPEIESISILVNLIEKQQKEIKKYKKFTEDKTKIGKDIQTFINKDYVEQEYISKDKIRDKIKNSKILKHNYLANTETSAIVYKDIIDIVDAQINVLKELLGE